MAQEQRVSVIICCYNDGNYLATALESLQKQTLERRLFRIIVVDDGSTDNTGNVIHQYPCVHKWHHENRGLPAACNTGLEAVDTPYFTRLDADDSFQPTALKRMLDVMEGIDSDMVFSDRWEGQKYIDLSRLPRSYPEYYLQTLQHLVAGGILFRTELARAIGGYDNMFWEEYDFLIRYLARSRKPLGYVPRGLYRYTIRADSMTHGLGTIANSWEKENTK